MAMQERYHCGGRGAVTPGDSAAGRAMPSRAGEGLDASEKYRAPAPLPHQLAHPQATPAVSDPTAGSQSST